MSPRDVLVITHDAHLAAPLETALRGAGHHVRIAGTVMAGLILAREAGPSVVLVERELPDGRGRDVITRLRGSSVPILVLTDRDIVEETVELLQLGANNVLVKPVAVQELVVQIRVQLRRPQRDEHLSYHGLEVWPHLQRVTVHGQNLRLTDKQRTLLAALLRTPGQIVSRADLTDALWPTRTLVKDSHALEVHVNHLRANFAAVGLHGVIHTVRQGGYMIHLERIDNGRNTPNSSSEP
ncbi:response regulator transcription factor [Deinococcus ruber]|uniref:DNA-binding response regulator n=1 Tax=Deinococcus ruber TaxID=1848197 RepID=A0A918FHM1_9DEIO|nr:response regulator transcription factor [Deinococcus ruber]GGR38320.1 DNA-binding response regulator [Deinococcus ruber]